MKGLLMNEVLKAVGELGNRVDRLSRGLALLTEGVGHQTKLLAEIHEACTADRPPSPLVEPLRQLAATCLDTASAVSDLVAAVAAQPDAVRAVIREELRGSTE
jgi:hypothetical protein